MDVIDTKIKLLFDIGFANKEILKILAHMHEIVISISTLKRKLKKMGLWRRKQYTDLLKVAEFILEQYESAGILHGYRWMHLKCIQSGINIPRDTVNELLKILDPEGVKSRLRKRLKRRRYSSPGPNFAWHLDSYDKLKPYGIAINGCIDGFSRHVLWLEAGTTNSDPKVIASYFIRCVMQKNGCPQRIRSDLGTENGYVETMQKFLRRNHPDEFAGDKSFISGKSVHNQRIEWFWSVLRKQLSQFYMNLFVDFNKDEDDLFIGDFLDKAILQFCFMETIQRDLDELKNTWNTHKMQTKSNDNGGGKRPILLYTMPELYNAEDRLCNTEIDEVTICEEETMPKKYYDETVEELCSILMEENALSKSFDVNECKELYVFLRRTLRHEVEQVILDIFTNIFVI